MAVHNVLTVYTVLNGHYSENCGINTTNPTNKTTIVEKIINAFFHSYERNNKTPKKIINKIPIIFKYRQCSQKEIRTEQADLKEAKTK